MEYFRVKLDLTLAMDVIAKDEQDAIDHLKAELNSIPFLEYKIGKEKIKKT